MNEVNFEYKRLCPFKWYVLENFPFIEEDFDAITNWQLFCKLGKELNIVINATNILGKQVEDLTEYFDNLDVQEEINNKLDEMAESGELQEIISSYINLNAVITIDTVSDLISNESLQAGSYVKTLGFYEVGDGGSAEYLIINNPALNTDDSFVIQLDSGLKAVLQFKEEVSILQLGAKRQRNNEHFNIHDYIIKYINRNELMATPFTLFLPAGIYYTTPIEIVSTNYNIKGQCERTGVLNGASAKATILTALNNQEYILKCGSSLNGSGYGTIENIIFSTCHFNDDFSRTEYKEVTNACLIFDWVYFMRSKYLSFEYIKGTAFKISTSWELMFDFIDFYHIDAHQNGIFVFDEVLSNVENGNISDSNFGYLRFEQLIGDCIVFNENSKTINVHFGIINIEPSVITDMGYTWSEYENIQYDNINSVFLLKGDATYQIDDLQLNNFYHRFHTINNETFIFGDIIHLNGLDLGYRIILNTIYLNASNRSSCLIKTIGESSDLWLSNIIVNNIINNSQYNMLLDVKKLARIKLNGSLGSIRIGDNRYIVDTGNRIACYKNASLVYTSVNGLIHYDADAINPEHLVIKNNGLLTSTGKRLFSFIYNSQTLKIRAKIENEQTVNFVVYGYNPATNTFISLSSSTALTGTGEFEEYSLSLSNITKMYGTIAYFQLVDNNDETDFELDTFSN